MAKQPLGPFASRKATHAAATRGRRLSTPRRYSRADAMSASAPREAPCRQSFCGRDRVSSRPRAPARPTHQHRGRGGKDGVSLRRRTQTIEQRAQQAGERALRVRAATHGAGEQAGDGPHEGRRSVGREARGREACRLMKRCTQGGKIWRSRAACGARRTVRCSAVEPPQVAASAGSSWASCRPASPPRGERSANDVTIDCCGASKAAAAPPRSQRGRGSEGSVSAARERRRQSTHEQASLPASLCMHISRHRRVDFTARCLSRHRCASRRPVDVEWCLSS